MGVSQNVIKRRLTPPEKMSPPPRSGSWQPNPRELARGDRFSYLGSGYLIIAIMYIGEDLAAYYADDARGLRRWFTVRLRPEFEVVWWWTGTYGVAPVTEPRIIVDGLTYDQVASGTVGYRCEGDTGHGEAGELDYIHFADSSGRYVAYWRFDDTDWGTGRGERVTPEEFRILPPSEFPAQRPASP